MKYYAHSGHNAAGQSDPAFYQLLADHLRGVAEGARERAADTGLPPLAEMAYAAGLFHDLGKYRKEFQEYIQFGKYGKGNPLTYHKQAGAAVAADASLGPIAFAILGHHGGVPDKSETLAAIKDGRAVEASVRSFARASRCWGELLSETCS